MNLKLTILTCCLFSISAAFAQETIGIQTGGGLSRIRSDYYHNRGKQQPRLNLGVTYDHFISSNATLSADLLYQQRGFSDNFPLRANGGTPTGTANIEFRFHYIALPLKVGFQFGNRGFGFGKIGLMPAVLLKAEAIGTAGITGTIDARSEFINTVQRFDLGALAEAGGGLRLYDKCQIYAALEFQHGISTLSRASYTPARHYGMYLNLGFRYVLRATKSPEARSAAR